MNLQKPINAMVRAIKNFNLIEENDNIAIGLSGGKDSLLLTACLATYKRFSPVNFNLTAICIDAFKSINKQSLEAFCKSFNVPLIIIPSDIGEVVFDVRKEKNPCSLCAKMRRGTLCSTAKNLNCNKLALAHNADDLIETFLMSLMHENRLSTIQPSAYMSNTDITVIRPLLYLWENQIEGYCKDFEVLKNPCPIDRKTERENIKNKLNEIEKILPDFKNKLQTAILHPERYNLLKK